MRGYNPEKRGNVGLQVKVNAKLDERAVKEEVDSDETPRREANEQRVCGCVC